ncbi:MAG: YunC family protein [Candidatus Anstonellaceae archaeon]
MGEQTIIFEGKKFIGLSFELGNLPLLVLKCKKGYIACCYLDKKSAENLGDVAAFVPGVKSFDEMLKSKIRTMTAWAEEIGIREGMSVKKAIELLEKD